MIINIAVPVSASAAAAPALSVETIEAPGQSIEINLELPSRDFSDKVRVFLTFKGERQELIARVSPAAQHQVMKRMISAALNAPPELTAGMDAFELRILGLLVVSTDCLMSRESLFSILEHFYSDFEENDISTAIEALQEKLAAARLPVKILGEAESGFRLQG